MKCFLTLLLTTFFSSFAMAGGDATYKQVCMACHSVGVAGAPKLGDKVKWAPLIKEGQVVLTAHGYVGIRGMPAKGGQPNLSVEKFAAALVYMVNNSGGSWTNPDSKTLVKINQEIENRKKEIAKK